MDRLMEAEIVRGARIAAALALLAVLALVALLGGCGGDNGASAAGSAAGPEAFADESFAELATDGSEALWMAVAGYERGGTFGLRVFQRSGESWEAAVSPPGEVSSDVPISITIPDNSTNPCLGYSVGPTRKPVVACLQDGEWNRQELPSVPNGQLVQLDSDSGGLLALVVEKGARAVRYRLLTQEEGEWKKEPPVLAPPGVARLAIESPAGSESPAIGLATQGRVAQHLVFELKDGSWTKLRPSLEDVGTGPLVGGPVVLPRRIYYPVTEADSEPWRFSVQSARIGSADAKAVQLSSGAGNSQGRLDLAGDEIWATWQEDKPRKDGRFRARIFAAELGKSGEPRRRVKLWSGLSIGPGSTQVIEFQGDLLALYMRSGFDGRGLRATVKRLP